MDILVMLILPINEHVTCFHLFVSPLISFFIVLWFSEYRSFTSLIRFIPRYFIFLVVILNGFFSLISVSDISLLVCKNAFNFWILTLYPVVFPNSLIRLSSFFGEVYRIFYIHYHVICKQWQFCFLLSNLDAFSFFFLSDCCGLFIFEKLFLRVVTFLCLNFW